MATPSQPCLTCRRPTAEPGGYCTDCKPEYGYDTPLWRHTRLARLEHDRHLCQYRHAGCTGRATTVHRLPRYGTVHDGNLHAYRSACTHCHGVEDGARATRPSTL
jgi:hypothetical protein